ncbi:MAG TPA: hypothetical protein VFC19_26245 [Candidatus Limnocylindrales bacterium]|nr:hypothetical protein [Candidatus Limnocylindrales bacterium]
MAIDYSLTRSPQSGGEAWTAHREGRIDAQLFGVVGTENWGPGEIRGNAIRDLAALNKVEMLPWDEWGRMEASSKGETGADYDRLMDVIAQTCAADDPAEVAGLYRNEDLEVPRSPVMRFARPGRARAWPGRRAAA